MENPRKEELCGEAVSLEDSGVCRGQEWCRSDEFTCPERPCQEDEGARPDVASGSGGDYGKVEARPLPRAEL